MGACVELTCPVCSKLYTADTVRLSFGRQTTCSRKCSYQSRSARLEVDLTGRKFGRWVVVERSKRTAKSGAAYWTCRCVCGESKDIFCSSLLKGASTSCGCIGHPTARKPGRRTREYIIWKSIKQRCENPNCPAYPYYGGRGIYLCDRWQNFNAFLSDMGMRPSPKLTIERKDNDGPYSPENCVWDTRKAQSNNRRNVIRLTFNGETLTLSQWAKKLGVPPCRLYSRHRKGWPVWMILT